MRMLIFALLLPNTVHSDLTAADRPNFVWLISEDNSSHFLKLFDEHGAETPNIAKLAQHGLIFNHAFSNAPVCSVARTTLITGCYAPRIGTQFHRRAVTVPLPLGLTMFPESLRDAGYYTTNNSKKDYNAVESDGVWDESSRQANWSGRAAGQPFFHMQSFVTTHESSLHFSPETMANQQTVTDRASVFVAPYHPDTPTFRYTYARYHDRIQQVDREVGAVVDRLEQEGLLDDTFVFYFGDHGGVLPRGKGYAYESGLHVPLVIRVPEKWRQLSPAEPGSRIDGFVSFIDFGPTLLNLAGLTIPAEVDGLAFLGRGVTLDELNLRDEAFGYADRFDEKYDFVRTLRKGRFEYVRNYQPFNFDGLQNNYRYRMLAYKEWRDLFAHGKLSDIQRQFFEPRSPEALYDIAADPHEIRNLANDPEYVETLAELRSVLQRRVRDLPDLSFFPESELVSHAFDNPTAFGSQQRNEIEHLADIADLSLLPYAEARAKLESTLNSVNPWRRYWGYIVCSCFRNEAAEMAEHAILAVQSDPELLVRVRACEFLGLNDLADPRQHLVDSITASHSHVEANLMFNTLVLLRDGSAALDFSGFRFSPDMFTFRVNKNDEVVRRLTYLNGGGEE